jgi:signal transduction histidine kinase
MRGLVASLTAARTALNRRPGALDAVLAGALAALVTWEITATDVAGPIGLLVVFGLLATLPLVARRRFPVAVVITVAAAVVVLDWFSVEQEPQTTLLPFLTAVYSVGAYAEGRWTGVGLGGALIPTLVDEPDDFVVIGPLTTATWLVGRLVRSWRRQAADLGRLADALDRERAENARLAVTDERARIARELHDVVGHTVSLMVLQAGAERLALGEHSPSTRDALAEIEQSGRSTLAELRRLVGVLRRDDEEPELAPAPGLTRLPELVEHVRQTGLAVDLQVAGEPRPLPPGLDVSAYRIVQEALTNTVKHSMARRVRVCIRYDVRELGIDVTDDGPAKGSVTANGGHGLVGMRERVSLYGGKLTVGPMADAGFSVEASLPLNAVDR